MQADLHPVELGKDVVVRVQRAVQTDVALDSAQDLRNGATCSLTR